MMDIAPIKFCDAYFFVRDGYCIYFEKIIKYAISIANQQRYNSNFSWFRMSIAPLKFVIHFFSAWWILHLFWGEKKSNMHYPSQTKQWYNSKNIMVQDGYCIKQSLWYIFLVRDDSWVLHLLWEFKKMQYPSRTK